MGGANCPAANLAKDSEVHPLRCVTDEDAGEQGWRASDCDNLWHESDGWEGGCQRLNYNDAVAFCASQNARLPTLLELHNDCMRGSGCSYDVRNLWSSSNADDGNAKSPTYNFSSLKAIANK